MNQTVDSSRLIGSQRVFLFPPTIKRGEEQNREEGEMAQKKLGGGRNRGEK